MLTPGGFLRLGNPSAEGLFDTVSLLSHILVKIGQLLVKLVIIGNWQKSTHHLTQPNQT
jgi:hypothetical protein